MFPMFNVVTAPLVVVLLVYVITGIESTNSILIYSALLVTFYFQLRLLLANLKKQETLPIARSKQKFTLFLFYVTLVFSSSNFILTFIWFSSNSNWPILFFKKLSHGFKVILFHFWATLWLFFFRAGYLISILYKSKKCRYCFFIFAE